MNETECENLIKSVKWTEPSNLISLAILEFINVLVIGGNLLVIAAVFCSNKLRSVTNFFIVNLAVADLLVGLAVLPFSATWEVFKVWIFGDLWCRIWLAVDVWMCTASILNLCAISLDRYVAVTRPVTYPSIMSTKRAKSLIAGIWVLSFVICFPPLVGWKDQKPMVQTTYTKGNYTLYYATTTQTTTTTTATLARTQTAFATATGHKLKLQQRYANLVRAMPLIASSYYSSSLSAASASSSLASETATAPSTATSSSSASASAPHNTFKSYDPYNEHLRVTNRRKRRKREATTKPDELNANDDATKTWNDFYRIENRDYQADEGNAESDDDEEDYDINPNNYDDSNDYIPGVDKVNLSQSILKEADLTGSSSSRSSTIAPSISTSALPSTTSLYNEKDLLQKQYRDDAIAATASSMEDGSTAPIPPCPWKCELTNDRGYVLYSALGSFYIPMFVMLFFYWRIYRAAVRTTRAINQGFKTTKGSPHESRTNRVDESQLVLRIHRGRPCSTPQRTPMSVHSMSSTLSVNSNDEMLQLQHHHNPLHQHHSLQHQQQQQQHSFIAKRATSMRVPKAKHEKVSIKVSFPSSENMLDSNTSLNSTPPMFSSMVTCTGAGNAGGITKTNALTNGRRGSFKSSLLEIGETTFNVDSTNTTTTPNSNTSITEQAHNVKAPPLESHRDSLMRKSDKKHRGKRSVKFQVKRFKVETKAAKTLAIIVGGFIFCWLPFFTMYLIRAFCEDCIPGTVFSVLFWLGYCNSAINPLIYALFSHEFRIAFKRIVCRCVCTRSGFRASENFQMIAARALMAPATFHKTISGCSDDGDGPDFS